MAGQNSRHRLFSPVARVDSLIKPGYDVENNNETTINRPADPVTVGEKLRPELDAIEFTTNLLPNTA